MANPRPKAGPGRPKGLKNKLTRDVKEMVIGALAAKGGQKYLEEQAEKNPVAFMSLIAKIIPTQVAGDPENPLHLVQTVTRRIIDGK